MNALGFTSTNVYDAAGNRARVVESGGGATTYVYDATYQLTAARRAGGTSPYALTYTYDAAGNRLRKLDAGAPTTYAYDGANQLSRYQSAAGYTTNTYDGSGNLARTLAPAGRTTYSWDGEDRLTRVAPATGTINTYVYNGDGLRVKKQDTTLGPRNVVWDGQIVLLETNFSNVLQSTYTTTPSGYGQVVSQASGATPTVSYYLFDGLGSMRQLARAGVVIDTRVYEPFGEAFRSGSTKVPYEFIGEPGYYLDRDFGMYYVRARHYDPVTGRWISRDPIASDRLYNFYRYVNNNPINISDPSGHLPILIPILLIGSLAIAAMLCVSQYVENAHSLYPLPAQDKSRHCYAACTITQGCDLALTATILGVLKEYYDYFTDTTGFDFDDLVANNLCAHPPKCPGLTPDQTCQKCCDSMT